MSVALVVVPSNAEKRQWLRPDKPSMFYELENSEVTEWIASPRDHMTCVRGVTGSGKTTAVRRAVEKMRFKLVEVRTMTEILGGLYPLKTENVALIQSAETSISIGDANPLAVQLIVFDGIDSMPSVFIEKMDSVFRKTKGVQKPFGSTSCVMTGFYALGLNRCRLAETTLGPGFDYVDVGSFRDAGADVVQIELKTSNLRIDPDEHEWNVFLSNLHDLIEGKHGERDRARAVREKCLRTWIAQLDPEVGIVRVWGCSQSELCGVGSYSQLKFKGAGVARICCYLYSKFSVSAWRNGSKRNTRHL